MKRFTRRIGALLAAGVIGAIAAVVRRRAQGAAPEPLASGVDDPPPSTPVPPDAQAAIDEARDRLRARAEALRQEIDGER